MGSNNKPKVIDTKIPKMKVVIIWMGITNIDTIESIT